MFKTVDNSLGRKKIIQKEAVTIYYTPKEKLQIEKKAGKELLGVSPFLRKKTIEHLEIKTDEES